MEENPDVSYEFVRRALIAKVENESGQLGPYTFESG